MENKREELNQQKEEKTNEEEIKKGQDKISFIWVILGIGAILLIWLLSSLVYK